MELNNAQVCEDLMLLVGRVKFALFQTAEAHNLTPPQLFALYAIYQGIASTGRIAHSLHCDASNVTGVVDRLVAQKLVVRTEKESDRRTKLLELTPEGCKLIKSIIRALPERLGCNTYTATERAMLHSLAQKLSVGV